MVFLFTTEWNEKDIIYLQANYHKMSAIELASHLQKKVRDVLRQAKKLQLTKDVPNHSPYPGVFYDIISKKWKAKIKKGIFPHIINSQYNTAKDAHKAIKQSKYPPWE